MLERTAELTTNRDDKRGSAMAPSTRALLAKLVDLATFTGGSDRQEAEGTLEKALAVFAANPATRNSGVLVPARGGLAPWQARRVAAHIRENVGTRLRASYLARLVKLSNSHFNRAFKVSFQETPTAYILRQRMRFAKDMMLSTSQPLSQIALLCGLCDQAHFSRMFRRFVGESPRVWRRRFASEPDVATALDSCQS
jgi:AraC family transcriptional regulator